MRMKFFFRHSHWRPPGPYPGTGTVAKSVPLFLVLLLLHTSQVAAQEEGEGETLTNLLVTVFFVFLRHNRSVTSRGYVELSLNV